MNPQFHLVAVNVISGQHFPCIVTASEPEETCQVVVSIDDETIASGQGYDFELALQLLRSELEANGLHLLCNRYRRNAYVSSLSRQMSNGLSCYLVRPRRPVDPGQTVDCLGAADESDVVSREEADAYIAKYLSRPPVLLLVKLMWRNWRDR